VAGDTDVIDFASISPSVHRNVTVTEGFGCTRDNSRNIVACRSQPNLLASRGRPSVLDGGLHWRITWQNQLEGSSHFCTNFAATVMLPSSQTRGQWIGSAASVGLLTHPSSAVAVHAT